jgi:DHA1 family bicyclomycin/chloramphenicol resistance-like MFS transporter
MAAPWAVLPVALNSVGVSLVFPTLSLKMLDRYPLHRGAASSVQAFVWGMMTGLIAGVVAERVSGTGVRLALGALALMGSGFLCWRWYARLTPVDPPIATSRGEEPTEPA